MSRPNDGGPAFPQAWSADMGWSPRDTPPGMTLRDYFAGEADVSGLEFGSFGQMCAFIGQEVPNTEDMEVLIPISAKVEAKVRYIMADAMLAEREKGGE